MKLLRLSLDNFRGAPNGTWSFTNPTGGAPLDTILVTGPAASGKTTFLEAIAALKESVAAWGMPPDPARLLRRGVTRGKVEGTWLLSEAEMKLAEVAEPTITTSLELGKDVVIPVADAGRRALFEAYSHDPKQGKFEYFPSNRRLAPREGQKPLRTGDEARHRLGSAPDKYASIKQALIDVALADGLKALEQSSAKGLLFRAEQRDSLVPYKKDIATLLPHLRLAGVDHDGEKVDLRFQRADGTELRLDDLSDSEKQGILFAVTFRRIGLSHSIVLVDQPELYLHADDQLGFVRSLGALGADNQIFLATGSLEITRTAAAHQVVRLGGAKG